MKKYIFPIAMILLFIAVATSCALRHDSCGAYNKVQLVAEEPIMR